MQNIDLCIYHNNCPDGFTAAWAIWEKYANTNGHNIDFFAATYGKPMPDVSGKDVLLVDFCYSLTEMTEMAALARSVTVLDHHKTAQAAVEPLLRDGVIKGVFDMNKSGARLAYEWANPGITYIPKIVQHVEDRDLWRYAIPNTHEICFYLDTFEYRFHTWHSLWIELELGGKYAEAVRTGEAIRRKFDKEAEHLAENSAQWLRIGEFTVPVVNCSYLYASEVGNRLAKHPDAAFAASFFINKVGDRIFSLRSLDEKEDVSAIAQLYGGGGHRNASGFKLTQAQAFQMGLS